jgi:hypothetical protein
MNTDIHITNIEASITLLETLLETLKTKHVKYCAAVGTVEAYRNYVKQWEIPSSAMEDKNCTKVLSLKLEVEWE